LTYCWILLAIEVIKFAFVALDDDIDVDDGTDSLESKETNMAAIYGQNS
jgi:hypothetical protein